MRNYLKNYLQELSRTAIGLDFGSFTCRYGKFTIFCLVGPGENIVHLTFAHARHAQAQKQLAALHPAVHFRSMRQDDFRYNQVFAGYFKGRLSSFPITAESPFMEAGTDFQQRIWHQIAAIPHGSVVTYKELAEKAGLPGRARPAAMACGANPMALIIPCHRVVAAHGIGGFAGGAAMKKALLDLERNR